MSNEEREHEENGLGELPEPLFNERGGFPKDLGGDTFDPTQQLPPDLNYQQGARADSQGASLLSPPYKEQVTSIHGVRPINARDFVYTQQIRVNIYAEAQEQFRVVFEVPQGFVAILKSFRWEFSNPNRLPTALYNTNELQYLRIESGNVVQQNYDDLWPRELFDYSADPSAADSMQVPLSGAFETYVLADEGKLIELVGALPASLVPDVVRSLIDFTMYGTLLLKRGLPVVFEPGSV